MNPPLPNFYDLENARQLVGFAAASYASDPADASDLSAMASATADVIANEATDTRAVIYQPTEQDTIVAFRGTRSLRNFVTDIKARRAPLLDGPAGAEVHEGFQIAFRSVCRGLGDFLRGNLSKQQLWLTGHSLGGALAKLAAARFFREHAIAGVYTFGEPRAGNAAFRDCYDYWLRSKTFRVVDGADFITRLPWWWGAFHHCGTEIFYDSLGRARVAPPWWVKGPSDLFGAWAEWRRDGRLALLSDHHINRYVELLSVPNPTLFPSSKE
jgi:triacylglycerol lipase